MACFEALADFQRPDVHGHFDLTLALKGVGTLLGPTQSDVCCDIDTANSRDVQKSLKSYVSSKSNSFAALFEIKPRHQRDSTLGNPKILLPRSTQLNTESEEKDAVAVRSDLQVSGAGIPVRTADREWLNPTAAPERDLKWITRQRER